MESSSRGSDTSVPVQMVLAVTSVNLHGLGASSANLSSAGPTVKFEMRQEGHRLQVANLSRKLNLSMPLAPTANASALCVGAPTEADVLALASTPNLK